MSLATVTALTHAIPTTDMTLISNTTDLDKIVPYPHTWVNPVLGINNDDSTFVVASLKQGGVQVYAGKRSHTSGVYSNYTLDKKTQNSCIRIKYHCTGSFAGILGPFVLSVSCKIRWWPPSVRQDIIAMPIPGLCVGGDMSPLEERGYLVLVREL